jgi:iron complex transport system substrate-binding protein
MMNTKDTTPTARISRRRFLIGAAVAVVSIVLAACAPPDQLAQPTAAPATSAPATKQPTDAPNISAFPVTLAHKFGEVTIPAEPQRVIALGFSEVDPILALGVVPVAVRDWFGDQPNGVWEWSRPALGDVQPEVLKMPFGELNFEKLAALQPDLIVATHSGIAEKEYAQLAQIAPTLAQSGDVPDFGMSWQDQTRVIGQALGRERVAQGLVAKVETQIAAAAQAHPEFAQTSLSWFSPAGDASYWAVGPNTPPMKFLAALGFQYPEALREAVGEQDSLKLSAERMDLLSKDVLILYASTQTEMDAMRAEPIIENLPAVKAGHALYFVGNDPVFGALSFSTVASLPYAVEKLTPQLAAAMSNAGTQATSPSTRALQVTGTANEYRLVKDALGEKQIPLEPKCIVAAGSGYLDHLLAIGVTPCGAAHGPGGSGFPEHLADQLKDVAYVGGTLEINLESVTALKPDLILAMHPAHTEGDFKTLLDPITTTVYLTEPWADWRAAMREIAMILGKGDIAEQRLAEFEDKLASGKGTLSGKLAGQKVMFLRIFPEKLRIYGVGSPTGDILYRGLGLMPATLTPSSEHSTEISLEKLPEIDADHIFLLDQTKDQMTALTASPLWQKLAAVQNNQIYPVDVKIWVQGEGVFAYDVLIDDVLKALGE